MDESVLDKAKLRLEALEKEAEDLRQFISMYLKFSASDNAPRPARPRLYSMRYHCEEDRFSTKEEIIETARAVLKQIAPRPLHIGDLYDALIDRGIKISGLNPKGNLSAKLAPPDDIVYVRDEGWYYRPKRKEPPDRALGRGSSGGSDIQTQAKGREAVPGGGT